MLLATPEPATPTGLKGVPVPIGEPPDDAVYHCKIPAVVARIFPGPATFHVYAPVTVVLAKANTVL